MFAPEGGREVRAAPSASLPGDQPKPPPTTPFPGSPSLAGRAGRGGVQVHEGGLGLATPRPSSVCKSGESGLRGERSPIAVAGTLPPHDEGLVVQNALFWAQKSPPGGPAPLSALPAGICSLWGEARRMLVSVSPEVRCGVPLPTSLAVVH